MYVGSDQLQSVLLARRLVLLTRQVEKNQQKTEVDSASFKELLGRDEVTLSNGTEEKSTSSGSVDKVDTKGKDPVRRMPEYPHRLPSEDSTFDTLA